MYTPLVFKLPKSNINDFITQDKENLIILSPNITHPLFSLGFHHFIERTKDAMDITNKLETKNEFYFVVQPFEPNISNYNDNINNFSKKYFNKEDIMGVGFYKMWEISFIFDIIDDRKLTFASLAEEPESFLQSIIYFRQKLMNKDISKDNIFSVMVHPEKESEESSLNQFAGTYSIKKLKTYPSEISKNHKSKTNGDITDIKTISLFKKEIDKTKKYANLVIANGENIWENKNTQEQESYRLILGEIIAGVKVLEKDGSFVIKIYDTFTLPTIKIIWILSTFFNESYVYKPFFSRQNESEKYIICKQFKFNQTDKDCIKAIEYLELMLKSLNTNYFLNSVIADYDLSSEWLNVFKFINIRLVNIQQIIINEIVKYIKENNYFGDKYHQYRNNQIEATKWWISMFYPDSNNSYKKNKENFNKIFEETINKNDLEIKSFINQLI
jgi:hypothetical protein